MLHFGDITKRKKYSMYMIQIQKGIHENNELWKFHINTFWSDGNSEFLGLFIVVMLLL